MARGRPVDPTKERHGAAVARPQATINAPPTPSELATMEPPEGMPEYGCALWRICLAEMAGNRHLRAADLVLLRAYCEAAQILEDASSDLHDQELVVVGVMGGFIPNPLIRIQKDATATLRQLSDVLGLNPLARIRAGLMEIAGASLVFELGDKIRAKVKTPAAPRQLPPARASRTPARRKPPAKKPAAKPRTKKS